MLPDGLLDFQRSSGDDSEHARWYPSSLLVRSTHTSLRFEGDARVFIVTNARAGSRWHLTAAVQMVGMGQES